MESESSFIQEKLELRLTFNPGLALIDFRTTGPRELGVGCESLCHTHVFAPKLIQILNSNPSKRNKWTSFYRSRSLLVASLSGGIHAGCKR